MSADPSLWVVVYHYVRDLPRSRYPRLKGLPIDRFHRQVQLLRERYEMATLDTAMAYLEGRYRPSRDLCLLTFDDGLRDHHQDVWPVLAETGVQGVFFVSTACFDGVVASVHKNHLLMASMSFDEYRAAVFAALASSAIPFDLQRETASATYRWDTPDVAEVKYLVSRQLAPEVRDRLFDDLFRRHFGDERSIARELYLTWDEARDMQSGGMVIGGHAHRHVALGTLSRDVQRAELRDCFAHLTRELNDQPAWPFSYPYGSHDPATQQLAEEAGFVCSFTIEPGPNGAGADRFALRRIDTNDVVIPES